VESVYSAVRTESLYEQTSFVFKGLTVNSAYLAGWCITFQASLWSLKPSHWLREAADTVSLPNPVPLAVCLITNFMVSNSKQVLCKTATILQEPLLIIPYSDLQKQQISALMQNTCTGRRNCGKSNNTYNGIDHTDHMQANLFNKLHAQGLPRTVDKFQTLFVWPDGSLPCSQQPANGHYPERGISSPQSHNLLL
jgi:hypothetical protein